MTFPSWAQYFPSLPGAGGLDVYADYCPYYAGYASGDCQSGNTHAYFFYGELPGPGSRCWAGTYQLAAMTTPLQTHSGCLQTACSSLTNLIEISLTNPSGSGPPIVATCPLYGGTLDLAAVAGSPYAGTISCPPASALCTGSPCDVQDCSGHGACNPLDGTCSCATGYFGPDAYSCPYRHCPTNATGATCGGHGTCDITTGLCACAAGWSKADCSRAGCAVATSAACPGGLSGAACECAAQGACVAGACSCNAGFIGAACDITGCPTSAGGAQCSNGGGAIAVRGTCDTALGLCSCADTFDAQARPVYFTDAACATQVNATRTFTQLNFVGEVDPSNNATFAPTTGTLQPKAFQYFSFTVPSVQFPLTLTLTLGAALPGPAPILTAAYASSGRPTASTFDFGPGEAPSSQQAGQTAVSIVFKNAGSASLTSPFSRTGTMLVAIAMLDTTSASPQPFSLSLTRDGCATISCSFGSCSSGACRCDRATDNEGETYGWSGALCTTPDCPGTPDCNGARGTCVVPPGAFSSAGAPVRGALPVCSCAGAFSGDDCSLYALGAGARVVASTLNLVVSTAGLAARRYTYSGAASIESAVLGNGLAGANATLPLINGSFAGGLAAGSGGVRAVVDPRVLGASGFSSIIGASGTIGLYARLDFSASPAADGILLTQVNTAPSLSSYRDFDIRSWRASGSVQEISIAVPGAGVTFLGVFNGHYARAALSYSLYLELSPACPPALAGCGAAAQRGACVGGVCSCTPGWEGIRCDVGVPVLADSVPTTTPALAPGDWTYFTFQPAAGTREVVLTLAPTFGSSGAATPLLAAAWDSGRFGTSLARVTSEAAYVDFDSVAAASNGSQTIVIARASPAAQSWLYIGVRNMPSARAAFSGAVTAREAAAPSLAACTAAEANATTAAALAAFCRAARCFGRGTFVVVNGAPGCSCDLGWNADTRCLSPVFASFSNVLSAAQNVSSLCTACTTTGAFARDQMAFFRVAQPLQKGTGLLLSLHPVPNANGSAAVAAGAAAGVSTGYPSLLVSPSLPRGILDFLFISFTPGANRSLLLTNPSSSGSYWAAVYANTPGTFELAASRAKLPVPPAASSSSLRAFIAFVLGSTAAKVVIGVGAGLLALMLLSCLADCCCSRSVQMGRLRARFDEMEEEHEREEELRRKSMSKLAAGLSEGQLAQTPALAQALQRHVSRYGETAARQPPSDAAHGRGAPPAAQGGLTASISAASADQPAMLTNPIGAPRRKPAAVSLLASSMAAGNADLAHLGGAGAGAGAGAAAADFAPLSEGSARLRKATVRVEAIYEIPVKAPPRPAEPEMRE